MDKGIKPSKTKFYSFNPEKPNSTKKFLGNEGEPFLKQFYHDSCKLLKKGEEVIVFHKYQLDALIQKFDDDLFYSYKEQFNWWVCYLKSKVKIEEFQTLENHGGRNDVTREECLKLKAEGYTIKQIAAKLNCGVNTINRRLGMGKENNNEKEK